MSKLKELLIFGTLFGLFLGFWWLKKDPALDFMGEGRGPRLENFQFTSLEGEPVKLSDFEGKILLLTFWASWCAPCLQELPTMVALHRRLKEKGFEILGINMDESPQKVAPPLAQDMGIRFPIAYEGPPPRASEELDVTTLPFNLLLGPQREVLLVERHGRDWAKPEIIASLEQLLREKIPVASGD